jgi:hypothetical protein
MPARDDYVLPVSRVKDLEGASCHGGYDGLSSIAAHRVVLYQSQAASVGREV